MLKITRVLGSCLLKHICFSDHAVPQYWGGKKIPPQAEKSTFENEGKITY